MIKPICDFCHRELTKFGGILFDPPRPDGFARKRHVCVRCMERLDKVAYKLCVCGHGEGDHTRSFCVALEDTSHDCPCDGFTEAKP